MGGANVTAAFRLWAAVLGDHAMRALAYMSAVSLDTPHDGKPARLYYEGTAGLAAGAFGRTWGEDGPARADLQAARLALAALRAAGAITTARKPAPGRNAGLLLWLDEPAPQARRSPANGERTHPGKRVPTDRDGTRQTGQRYPANGPTVPGKRGAEEPRNHLQEPACDSAQTESHDGGPPRRPGTGPRWAAPGSAPALGAAAHAGRSAGNGQKTRDKTQGRRHLAPVPGGAARCRDCGTALRFPRDAESAPRCVPCDDIRDAWLEQVAGTGTNGRGA